MNGSRIFYNGDCRVRSGPIEWTAFPKKFDKNPLLSYATRLAKN